MEKVHYSELNSFMEKVHYSELNSFMEKVHYSELNSFMEKVHYSELNSSAGHKIPYFFMATKCSQSCSEGCITSPCPQPNDPIPTKLGNVHTSSAHSFYCQPQIQNLIRILLFILEIKQKNRELRAHCSIMLWHVTWSEGNNTLQHPRRWSQLLSSKWWYQSTRLQDIASLTVILTSKLVPKNFLKFNSS